MRPTSVTTPETMKRADSEVTICVTPRERFSCAVDSLRDIAARTAAPYNLVYLDANSPAPIARELQQICADNDFQYLRVDEYLPPNRARNLALEHVTTPYVAFVDNDLFVSPGWLQALLACARDTGAWAVGPVVLEGTRHLRVVHLAGGDFVEENQGEYNRVGQRHRHMRQLHGAVRAKLAREAVGSFEFHCVLVRTEVLRDQAPLDEGFLSHQEHLDLAREIRRAGGEIWFEPDAVVRYDNARRFEDYDREFFELRWSVEWTEQSIEHTRRKWRLAPDDKSMQALARWTDGHRRLFERSHRPWTVEALPTVLRRTAGSWLRELGLLPTSKLT